MSGTIERFVQSAILAGGLAFAADVAPALAINKGNPSVRAEVLCYAQPTLSIRGRLLNRRPPSITYFLVADETDGTGYVFAGSTNFNSLNSAFFTRVSGPAADDSGTLSIELQSGHVLDVVSLVGPSRLRANEIIDVASVSTRQTVDVNC